MRITQGTFSFLPDLTDDQIEAQIAYALGNDWAIMVEIALDEDSAAVIANMTVTGLCTHVFVRNLFYDRANTAETVNFRGNFLVVVFRSEERQEPVANARVGARNVCSRGSSTRPAPGLAAVVGRKGRRSGEAHIGSRSLIS